MTHSKSPTNTKRLAQLEAALAKILAETLQRGFFGEGAIELSVQDGTIQSIRYRVERLQK